MGTRSLTYVYDKSGAINVRLVCMYRQYDGYPSGHGLELAEFLTKRKIINGISGDTSKTAANGMGCLAAQIVSHFKGDSIGGVYLYSPVGRLDVFQEYEYHVYEDRVKVLSYDEKIFSGSWTEFLTFCKEEE